MTPVSANTWAPRVRSLLRMVAAFLLLFHGTQKLFGWPGDGSTVELFSQMGLGGVIEAFVSALLLVGLFARPAAFLLSGTMAVAYWQFHADFSMPLGGLPMVNDGELAALYCFVFLYLFVAGPGPWSLDARRKRAG